MAPSIEVLHVDDDADFADLTAAFLEREDDRFAVETASSAEEALDSLDGDDYDCIVSDYDMPGRNGISLLEAVREDRPDLPFVLFTGKGSEQVASEAISAGVTDYLQKGSDTSQYAVLANRIENVVAQYRAERRARETTRRLEAILENTTTPMFMKDADGEYLLVNRGFRDLFGLDEGTVVGRTDEDLFPPEMAEEVRANDRQELDEGDPIKTEERIVVDGDERIYLTSKMPIFDLGDGSESDSPVAVFGVAEEITERKRRERELAIFQQAFDEAHIPLVLSDPSREDNPLVYVNDAFERVTGYSPEEAVGRNCRFLQGEGTDPDRVERLREAIENEERVTVELRNYRKDGTEFWNRLTVLPIYDEAGTLVRYFGSQEDVTERKRGDRTLG